MKGEKRSTASLGSGANDAVEFAPPSLPHLAGVEGGGNQWRQCVGARENRFLPAVPFHYAGGNPRFQQNDGEWRVNGKVHPPKALESFVDGAQRRKIADQKSPAPG
jgi:hypothetical protein